MRLRIFQANDGDCLLLSSSDDHHMLVDGGRSGSFVEHTSEALTELSALDLVCVSHIDADHITGILKMLETEVDWRIHKHEKENPPAQRRAKRKPSVSRPPDIKEIWHNGFGDQLADSAGEVSAMLSLAANAQLAQSDSDMMPRQLYLADLALGEKQAVELSHRIADDQLNIPLNRHFDGKLIRAGTSNSEYELGDITLSIVGPFESELKQLREQWREWIVAEQAVINELQKEMDEDANNLGVRESGSFLGNMQRLQTAAGQLGDHGSVSAPNLASIMILAQRAGKSVLLTGDGSDTDIIKGLQHVEFESEDQSYHVNILKFPHHGAAANVDAEFTRSVIADHYVFCGNGSHSNPELDVIKIIAGSRFGNASARSDHSKAGSEFTLHFNYTPEQAGTEDRTKHMEKLKKSVLKLVEKSDGQMTAVFNSESFFDISV